MNIEIHLKGEIKDIDFKKLKEFIESIKTVFIWYQIDFNTKEVKSK